MYGLPLLALIATALPPVVQGTVGEPGAPAAGAQVTLLQGQQRQVRRTGGDGTWRFRPLAGPGVVSVVVPAGWTLTDAASRSFEALVPGDVVRLDFTARAHRTLRGRLLLSGVALAGVDVSVGAARTRTDPTGTFLIDPIRPGRFDLQVDGLGLSAEAQIPALPGEISRDFALQIRSLQDLDLIPVPQEPALRSLEDWAAARRMSPSDAARLEKLCALANLDVAFRLAILANPADVGRAVPAAVLVQRFLTGPCLVPPQRVVFAVGEVASPGRLAVLLARQENR